MKVHTIASDETSGLKAVIWYDRSYGWVCAIHETGTDYQVGDADYVGGCGRKFAETTARHMLNMAIDSK